MRQWAIIAGVATLASVSASRTAPAQRMEDGRAGVVRRAPPDSLPASGFMTFGAQALGRNARNARNFAPVVSAIVPGGGQLMLGDDRFIVYAAVEALSWWRYIKASREQHDQEVLYKDLAARVARANFAATTGNGPWSYYEAMRDWLESGSYSLSASGVVVPETDLSTFNGHQWAVAVSTNPDMASALAQYEQVAIKPDFRWSWKNAQLQYDIFKRSTFRRDDAYSAGVRNLIVIGANHVLSMVDAFATVRLSVRTDPGGQTSVGARVPW